MLSQWELEVNIEDHTHDILKDRKFEYISKYFKFWISQIYFCYYAGEIMYSLEVQLNISSIHFFYIQRYYFRINIL